MGKHTEKKTAPFEFSQSKPSLFVIFFGVFCFLSFLIFAERSPSEFWQEENPVFPSKGPGECYDRETANSKKERKQNEVRPPLEFGRWGAIIPVNKLREHYDSETNEGPILPLKRMPEYYDSETDMREKKKKRKKAESIGKTPREYDDNERKILPLGAAATATAEGQEEEETKDLALPPGKVRLRGRNIFYNNIILSSD